MYLVRKTIKKLCKEHEKRISEEAMEALDRKVESLVLSAIRLCKSHKTIKATEVQYSKA